ncbi:MAG: hypothetical protein KDD33_05830 [Bdellovibrionales bacterium]|nr:hypothetical protein [Bdellovibrionales bacterium]
MKFLLLSSLLFFALPSLADQTPINPPIDPVKPPCTVNVVESPLKGVDATAFNIAYCTQEQINEGIAKWYLDRSGYDFEWIERSSGHIKIAVSMMRKDHQEDDGDPAFEESKIAKILEWYFSDEAAVTVEIGEYADSYMSGTGIFEMYYFYTADLKTIIVVDKFVYAE